MLTQDENIIDIKFTVQYKVKDAREYLFNVRDPDATLRQATESAVREIVGKNELDFVFTEGRLQVAARAEKLIQEVLDSYATGILVVKLNMQDAQPPQQVQAAFDDAIKAREDEQRQINEAEAYANDIIPRARGTSARRVQEAEAYREEIIQKAKGESDRFLKVLAEYNRAPEVTRERLYLEAMESVLANSNKVMVDVKQGGSLMYLPVDKLMQSQRQKSVSPPNETTSVSPREVITEQESRLRDRLRSREDR
jgi:membrane protease subunit HflK